MTDSRQSLAANAMGMAGVAAIAAVPSAASAAATCSFSNGEMTVRYGANDTNVTVANAGTILYSEGDGFLRSCFSTSGVAATAANTKKVTVKANSSTTAPLAQTTTLDERGGNFMESNPNLQFSILTGSGRDRLIVRKGAGSDQVRLLDQTGGLAIGPAVDLDYDLRVDVRMTTGLDSIVQVNAGGGSDLIDAKIAGVFQVVLVGEAGVDTLVGGKKADSFDGGSGDDRIFAKDGNIEAVNGGADTDNATVDTNDQRTSIEKFGF